jgi:hypothetical protein
MKIDKKPDMKFKIPDLKSISAFVDHHRVDLIIISLLLVLASLMSWIGSHQVNPVIIEDRAKDVWFGADIARVFHHMATRPAAHNRLNVHPLFSLVTYPFVYFFMLLRFPKMEAVRAFTTVTAGLWVGLLYVTLRLIGCRRLDAALLSVLALTSAGFIFWTTVPESYLFGSFTMLGALCFVAWTQYQQRSQWWYVVISAATLTITTTNWMAGIFMAFASFAWRKAAWITVQSLLLVIVLWPIQKFFFRSAEFFIGGMREDRYIWQDTAGGPLRVLSGFFYHSVIMPGIYILSPHPRRPDWPLMSVQFALPGSGGIWGMIAVILWTVFLGLGIWACWRHREQTRARLVLAGILLGQLALFLVYGDETLLYALQIMPFLIVVCAFLTLTPFRLVALTLSVLLIITTGVNNAEQFRNATEFLQGRGPLRQLTPITRPTRDNPTIKPVAAAASIAPQIRPS